MYFIGVDIGTGSTKALAITPSGTVLATYQVPYPTFSTAPGNSEQSPETIWSAFTEAVRGIIDTLDESPEVISLSSAMHSVIPVTSSGKILSRMITWADNRSAEIATALHNSPLGRKIYEETGTPIHAMAPLCKIAWIKEYQSNLFSTTEKFISIKEYIWFRLFHVFEIDYSIASATALFNISTLRWHEDALAFAGIGADNLSTPVDPTTFRTGVEPEVMTVMGIKADTRFMIGASDGCLANVGSFATTPGVAALTIGTSGAIRVAVHEPALNFKQMTFNYRLNNKLFISGGPINNGGAALKWYAQNLLGHDLSNELAYTELLDCLDQIPAGSEGLTFLPYVLGERAPIWNSESCGVFFGVSARHRQEHFTKAVIEGIAMSLYQIGAGIESSGTPINQINVSGGFVRSHKWVQVLSNVFGKRVMLVMQEDASAVGAAYMAFDVLGIDRPDTPDASGNLTIFEPNMAEHEHYKANVFPMFEHLYSTLVLAMKIRHDQLESTNKEIRTTIN